MENVRWEGERWPKLLLKRHRQTPFFFFHQSPQAVSLILSRYETDSLSFALCCREPTLMMVSKVYSVQLARRKVYLSVRFVR